MAQGQSSANTQIAAFNNLRVNSDGYPYGLTDRSSGSSTVSNSIDCQQVFEKDCTYYYSAQGNTSGSTIPTLTYFSQTGQVTLGDATL